MNNTSLENIHILTLEESLTVLETLVKAERLEYFKANVLPILATTQALDKELSVKKASKLLNVSAKIIYASIEEFAKNTTHKSQADMLIEIATSNILFCDDLREAHTLIEFEDYNRIIKVNHQDFNIYITGEYYKQTGKAPSSEAIKQAINIATATARFDGEKHKLELRVAAYNNAFWYDLADEKNRAVKITSDGWQIINKPPALFRRRNIQDEQVEPVKGREGVWELSRFVNMDEDSFKLFLVYLVTCLIPEIPHPIPIFHGEKGAAKSTTMQVIRRLIDPSKRELIALPKNQNELAQQLSNNYMPCYDNLSYLSQMQSDMLCQASTGGGISKRTLYSNDDDTILKFFCCPVLNGINVVANATDLLDRCIIFELKRISEDERKESAKVFTDFESARQDIFTGLIDALSKAMKIYPTVYLENKLRMADFTVWGYAVAEALEIGGDTFIKLYRQNMEKINVAAIEENPLATAIMELMSGKEKIDCTPTELLIKLNAVAEDIKVNTNSKYWAKDPGSLSKNIMQIKSNLLDAGTKCYTYRLGGNMGRQRRVVLESIPNLPSPASTCS